MYRPQIPEMLANPQRAARRARRRGGLSFGYFSLATQRKVTRTCGAKGFLLEPINIVRQPQGAEARYRISVRDLLQCPASSKGVPRLTQGKSVPRLPQGRGGPRLPQGKSASRLTRESLFFACAKKSNQKKAHPGGTPTLRVGSHAGREFPEGTSMCRPETARVVRAVPMGFDPPCMPFLRGPNRAIARATRTAPFLGAALRFAQEKKLRTQQQQRAPHAA
ncbi:MAG TPA: hypothetical protein VK325_11815 [Pseudoxanthomonas sp.]|nr:hypothetical protein [Pseudoxanthomonas sp.]